MSRRLLLEWLSSIRTMNDYPGDYGIVDGGGLGFSFTNKQFRKEVIHYQSICNSVCLLLLFGIRIEYLGWGLGRGFWERDQLGRITIKMK